MSKGKQTEISPELSADIGIIGGGLSGVYLAYRLQQVGVPFVMLEAKDRLGGRVLTHDNHNQAGIDLGPTWFWPHQKKLLALFKELGLEKFPQYQTGDNVYQVVGQPPQRFADQAGMLSYRLRGGMNRLISTLAEHVDPHAVHLGQPLRALAKSSRGWTLSCGEKHKLDQFTVKHLVLSAPPRVLLQHVDGLRVCLSRDLNQTLVNTPTWMAAQAKFVVKYSTPFWREMGFSGHVYSRVGPMVEVHDASDEVNNVYGLFGFIGIDVVTRQQYTENQLRDMCLRQLAALFGEQALQYADACVQDWSSDSCVSTPQDLVEVSRHPECDLTPYSDELSQLDISFAVTECAEVDAGLLEGAIDISDQVCARIRTLCHSAT